MLAEEQKVKQAFYDAAFGYHLDANGNLETTPGRKSNSKMFTPKEHEDIMKLGLPGEKKERHGRLWADMPGR